MRVVLSAEEALELWHSARLHADDLRGVDPAEFDATIRLLDSACARLVAALRSGGI